MTIPSFVGRGSSSDLKRFRTMHTAQSDVLQSGEYVLRCSGIDGSEYFVGTLALSQSQSSTSARGDINRYWSTLMLRLLLTVLGTVIPDAEFEVSLVMGIPIETYSEQNRLKVRKALEGIHHFTLNGRERLAVVQVAKVIMEGADTFSNCFSISFEVVQVAKVIMEGAGAMIAVGDERMLRQTVIDIGGRTTDLYTADGQIPLIPLCKGTALGVELVGDLLNRTFQERSGRILSVQETRGILRAAVDLQRWHDNDHKQHHLW